MKSILGKNKEELAQAVKRRDAALKESQKVGNFQPQSAEANVTTRLENVLASHSKMQGSREKFQIKLVRIASDIAMLTKESFLDHLRIQNLEAEVEQLKAQRLIAEAQHRSKMKLLRKNFHAALENSRKLATRIDQAFEKIRRRQAKLDHAQEKRERREQMAEKDRVEAELRAARVEAETWAELRALHIGALRKKFPEERETARKAAQKELSGSHGLRREVASSQSVLHRCKTKQNLGIMPKKYHSSIERKNCP